MQNGAEPRGRVKKRLTAVGRSLRWLGRRILALPVSLVRLGARLPGLLWRGFKGLLRFLIRLPGRLGRGLKWLLRFLIRLPGRLGRSLKWLLHLLISLPRRLALEFHRLHLRWREWRARFAAWRRSQALRPRVTSPRTQRLILLTLTANLIVILLLSLALARLSRREPETIVVTATPVHTGTLPVVQVTLTAPIAPPADDPSAPPAASALLGDGGAVAFALRQDGNSDIYVRKLDDNQRLRLTFHPAQDCEPAWSPDGETLAFVSQRGNNWDIYRLDLVSGVLIRLTRHPHYDAHPSWSPDGAFIAFESYRSGNLDIFIMAADGSQILQLTSHQAADFAPAWSPDGRHIAFVSYRDGSKDIFLYPLDAGSESAVVNLTQTPDRDEDAPAWSPDGNHLAFSTGRLGEETIYVTTFDRSGQALKEEQTRPFISGAEPTWSPDGKSLVYTYQHSGRAFLIADSVSGWEAEQEIYSSEMPVRDPSWGWPTVDPQIVAQQRQTAPMVASALYIEEIQPTPEIPPPYFVVALQDVNGGDDREFLSDRVNDSFEALRQRVLEETGADYLATIGDSFRRITVMPPPGQSPYSWHKAGRAFDLNQGLYEREDQLIELVREDIGLFTYWRVYLRAARQDGSLGEPLHQAPWDLKARQSGGLAAREGGEPLLEVPLGYYVDLTQLALDYGWERVPANNRWREEWADVNWWQFQKPQGLSWLEAMLEIYRLDQIEAVFGPLPEQDR